MSLHSDTKYYTKGAGKSWHGVTDKMVVDHGLTYLLNCSIKSTMPMLVLYKYSRSHAQFASTTQFN
jgi:hypothetical protein